jgi:hypothetical protein
MSMLEISTAVSLFLAGLLAVAGGVHVCGPAVLYRIYPRREVAQIPHPILGALRIATALLLAGPQTRIWGGVLAALIAFAAVVGQLQSARYAHAIPGIVTMLAIPIAMTSIA